MGEKVEARFGGKAKYYGATVALVNGDGTYGVRYDDGDSEANVPLAHVARFAAPGQFIAGQRVEARFGGKGKWYGGAVVQDNGDGTYGVRYDDGDSEANVAFLRDFRSL